MRVFGVDVAVREGATDAPGETVVRLHDADGAPFLHVTRGEGGWRIDAPAFGRHLVSPDGRRVTVSAGDADRGRLLVAQSLPTAAALQGRDLFHASAIHTAAGVIALSGPSGSGKTTLARELVGRGIGTPFADDVLAVDGAGSAFAGPVLRDDPASVPSPDAAPLALLVLLDRTAGGDAPAPDPLTEVLAAAFAPHVDVPARAVTRLDACGRLLGEDRVRRLAIAPGSTVTATVEHLSSLLPHGPGPATGGPIERP